MTTEIWSPDSNNDSVPNQALKAALEMSDLEQLPSSAPESVKALQAWMNKPFALWSSTLTELDTNQLNQLVRFFTLAEATWSDWHGGDKNPAIWACKELKKHQAFPDKAFIEWIRQHTDNRFIPYGNVLG